MQYKQELYKAEYAAWRNMKQRCNNPKNPMFKHYGARGIKVCERWELFDNFLEDMGRRLSDKHSIERRDVNGDYEPGNCYWATIKEQSNNTTRTTLLEYEGKKMSIAQWADELGVPYDRLKTRHKMGWSAPDILRSETGVYRKPRKHGDKTHIVHYGGKELSMTEFANMVGLDRELVRSRIRYGWSIERIADTPSSGRRG